MSKNGGFAICNATFNLTQQCNLACEYCFTGGKSHKKMPLSIAKKCVDFLIKNALEADINELNGKKRSIDISFWGGEPLLEWQLIKDIVNYTKSVCPKEVSYNFGGTTNGTLLTPEKFDFLEQNKIFFMVSLDGTAETHNKYRIFKKSCKGSHETIMKNMEKVIEKWPFYRVRTSLYPESANRFYEDIKYLIDHKIYYIMFSPVYEHLWTPEIWKIWKEQCFKIVDLMLEYKKKGIQIDIEHFKSYTKTDQSKWPCGAGRFYVGFDTDGSIWPCHRFGKFGDNRPWQEKEMCIGHVDVGITRPEVRQTFIDFEPLNCGGCDLNKKTPCHGGCYALNFDLEGDIRKTHPQLCKYVEVQQEVSMYYKDKLKIDEIPTDKSCICYNMCYLEGSPEQISMVDDTGIQCHCYNTNYNGDPDTDKVARPIKNIVKINPLDVVKDVNLLKEKMDSLENKLDEILKALSSKG